MQKTIFVVDDNDTNLAMARDALRDNYRVMTLPSAEKMFSFMEKIMPDMILLDIEMPDMDGFKALELLKAEPKYTNIPVIFLTGMADAANEVRGFQMGVVDFISKPFSEPVLQNRIKTHLEIDEIIRERTKQLQKIQNGLIYTLADMVENRDADTGGHVGRTSAYIEVLMNAIMEKGVYEDYTEKADLETLASSARLHDVGKISISDTILNKPGKLTDEEFDKMKTHTVEGEKVIDQIIERTGEAEILDNAKCFAVSHHERWDGKGYPHGLKEESIPFQGRVMAIVDVYDALVSERPYKKPFTHEEAVKMIMDGAGTQFDPKIAEVFYSVRDKFDEIRVAGQI